MLCYKDRTFCEFENCYKFDRCDHAFTPEVSKAANEWWKQSGGAEGQAPIMIYVGNISCFVPKDSQEC